MRFKEYEKRDLSIEHVKRLAVSLTCPKELTHDEILKQAKAEVERYRKDGFCRSDLVRNHFLSEVAAGNRSDLTPDVLWIDIGIAISDKKAESAESSEFKLHLLWVRETLPFNLRPMGLDAKERAKTGLTWRFKY